MRVDEKDNSLKERLDGYLESLKSLREMVLANTVMCAEIPAPTFEENRLVRFLTDRFTESQLQNICSDEAGNAIAILPGKLGREGKNILLAAHVDRIWSTGIDHTVTVGANSMTGPGVADNSLGVATIASMPFILEKLKIELDHNIILLGATRSMGHGDLGGLRFFLNNAMVPINGAVCVEGVQLGRLSYSCLGMNRGEIIVQAPEEQDWERINRSGAIVELNRIIQKILAIATPQEPRTSIILGSVMAGSGFSVPPTRATLRFEVRSEAPGMVASIREQIEEIIEEANGERKINASLKIIARRKPGDIGFSHPLVKATRSIMETLDLSPRIAPSISELSVLLEKEIPSLTLGVTRGDNKHEINESIEIEPIFKGLAQIATVLEVFDEQLSNE